MGQATKAARVLLALLLAIGMTAPAAGAQRAYAAESGNLTVGRTISYDSYFTNWFEVDGQATWCGNPSMATPGAGSYPKQALSAASGRTAELAADMWFSYGSPGFDAPLWPDSWVDGSAMTPDRYTALAHILMADTYSSDGNYAMYGCSEAFRDWVAWNVLGFDDSGAVSNEDATGRLIASRTGEGIVSHVVEIREDGQFDQLVEADGILNEVVRGGVQVQKNDLELGESEALGGADHSSLADDGYLGTSLEGIGFTITNVSEHGVMVGGTYYPTGSVVAVIETAWNPEAQAYTAQTASDALPYGTYTVAETATNESYLLTDGEHRTFEVRGDGIVVTSDVDGGALLWSDQVVRHDMHLQKKGTVHGEKLGLVPFLITNVTIGEAHVAVTDRNGMLSTSSEWRSREESVNANDALIYEDYIDSEDIVEGSGIWFGTGEHGSQAAPDDSLDALPYGEYTIEEMRCEANEGYALWSDAFNVNRDTTETPMDIDLGTVDDVPEPRIDTVALDRADGDHSIAPLGDAVIVDEVSYANMPLEELTARGGLVDKATGEPLVVDGEQVVAEKTFAPISPSGTVNVEFEFDASGLAGIDIVVFEEVLLDGEVIAEHADILDADQTVAVKAAPEIGTVATDAADGDHMASADGESGFAVVSFELDASSLEGRSTVVFEKLYDSEGTLVASREDLEDEGQTVSFTGPSPEIGTTATDGDDGDHEAQADDDVTIVDEVRYENLEPGVEYVLTGTLVDRDAAKPVEEDGAPLTVEVRFTPEEADGSVEVVFRFDGTGLAGRTVVAFGGLTLDGEVVVEHKDPNDEGQSVNLVEPPSETPEEPSGETPNEPSTPAGKLPKTGDSLPLVPLACLVGATLTAAGAALMARRPDGPAPEKPQEGEKEGE